MLYQLKNLSQEEQSIVLKSPIWVTLLIACSDFDIEEAEIERILGQRYISQND